MARNSSSKPRRSPISFLQATLALVTALAMLAVYGLVATQAGEGWFRSFVLDVLPAAALLAGAYALSYALFFRHGLTRDQQLAERVSERVSARLGLSSSAVELVTDPARLDWEGVFRDSDHLFVAARSLARWSSELAGILDGFLRAGGTIKIVAHDPSNEANLARAAIHHGGYGGIDANRVSGNVLTGLRRLRAAASGASPSGAGAIEVLLIDHDDFVFTQAIFAFYRDGALQRVIVRPHENVRRAVTRGPLYVVDATRDAGFRAYVEREIDGLTGLTREAGAEDLGQLDQGEVVREGQ